jgi:hypothetical protein
MAILFAQTAASVVPDRRRGLLQLHALAMDVLHDTGGKEMEADVRTELIKT